jgi:CBS domain-containing protein
MTIASVLREKGSDVVSASPETTVQEIAEIIASRRIGAVVVLDAERRLAGIVSERDVVKALAANGTGVGTMRAEQIMTRAVITATPRTTIEQAMEIMDHGYFRHLPVVENGAMVGIISIRDVVKARIQHHEHEADNLRTFIHGRV